MMKRSGVRFLIVSLLLLLFIARFIKASEKEETKNQNEPGAENNVKEKAKDGIDKDELKETLIKKKEETLEEEVKAKAKEKDEDEAGSLDGDSHAEECDPSNRCVDEKSKFVACLRVAGKDSLDLSLLIQNKGKGLLDVNIVAPGFVNLEQNAVQLQPKENKEVKVSVKEEGGNNSAIVLKAREGSCSLNFQNMISNPTRKSDSSTLPGRFAHLSLRALLLLMVLAVFVLLGSAWSCIKYRKMRRQEGGPTKYQPVDMGLPISTGGKKDANETDGWDNNWEDDWDDEEAQPMTPSKPVLTPSAKGLASRRLIKDSWKD